MKISKIPGLGNYGHYVDGVDFATITDEEWMEIGQLHLKGLLTILRNVNLDKETYKKRILQFGPMKSNYRHTLKTLYGKNVEEYTPEDLEKIPEFHRMLIQSDEILFEKSPVHTFSGQKDLGWHSNESGTLTYSPGVSLLGVYKMVGTATGYLQTADYYESISDSFRRELDEMIVVHQYIPGAIQGQMELDNPMMQNYMKMCFCPYDDNEIPLVVTSPGGIRGLHYPPSTVGGIKGMTSAESTKLFEKINKELFVEKYEYNHWYEQDNDFLLFDNSIMMHRRIGGDLDRLINRSQFEYTNLTGKLWEPYHQLEFAELYKQKVQEVLETYSNLEDND